ncbi:MAG: dynamin family protein [Albidovulum sp.]|nr:dynamin family protein [Albidovulum sp.]
MLENHDRTTMDVEASYRNLLVPLTELESLLTSYKDVIDGDYDLEIVETIQSLREAEQNLAKDKLLQLGVVGQVNAGKSSLLNVLLFEGREVLPRAATPMTASLTKIQWSECDAVEVEYFSQSDWMEFKQYAEKYRVQAERSEESDQRIAGQGRASKKKVSELWRASHELVDTARRGQIRVAEYLGRKDCRDASKVGLNEILCDLVGVEGKLTPLVKSVTIRCKHGIQGLNIVDTPGINDPVASRSREAKKYLKNCDAVLMLSYTGQFMDAEDMKLLQRSLPDAGIQKTLVIGSKFDSVLIDVSRDKGGDLQNALEYTASTLRDQAIGLIHPQSDKNQNISEKEENVKFVSARCASLLLRPADAWSDDEREVFKNLCEAYPDCLDTADGEVNEQIRRHLSKIGNLDSIKDYINGVRANKHAIMEDKASKFLDESLRQLNQQLEHLEKDLDTSYRDLDSGSFADVEERIHRLESVTDNLEDRLKEKWIDLLENHLQSQFRWVTLRTSNEKTSKTNELNSLFTEVIREVERNLPGIINWLVRNLVGGGTETCTDKVKVENEIEIRSAVDDFIECIREVFDTSVTKLFQQEFRESARLEMNEVAAKCVTSDVATDLDIETVKRLIWRAVGQLCNSAKSSLKRASQELYEKTGGERGANSLLQNAFPEGEAIVWGQDALKRIAAVSRESTGDAEKEIFDIGEKINSGLLPAIKQSIGSERRRLEQDLKHRKFRQQRYKYALDAVRQCRNRSFKVKIK